MGESLVARAVKTALRSKFDPIYVYSDCPVILKEASAAGACAVERPEEVSADDTTTEETLLRFLEDQDPKRTIEAIAIMQCTTPFICTADLNRAYDVFDGGHRTDSVVTAVDMSARYFGYPKYDGTSEFIPMRPYRALRQQKSMKFWMENGGIYLAKRTVWERGFRIGDKCKVAPMGLWQSVEIDEPEDLVMVEALAKAMRKETEELTAKILAAGDTVTFVRETKHATTNKV